MAVRTIRVETEAVSCAVCGRRLLQGERPEAYLAGGARRTVCELCTTRASSQGWIREGAGLQLGHSQRPERRQLLGRFRARRAARGGAPPTAPTAPERLPEEPVERAPATRPAAPAPAPAPVHEAAPAEPAPPAVPTSAELKVERAMEVFNGSEHPRTVAGVARSLGAPWVAVRPSPARPSAVTVVVAWELCWYRYEVDLAEAGAASVAIAGQGYELSELPAEDRAPNAVADERGALSAAAAAP